MSRPLAGAFCMAKRVKKTAHEWANLLTDATGMRAYAKKLADKHGTDYLDDWLEVHKAETRWARRRLKRRDFTCLDTETTSTDRVAEMTEIGITDAAGEVLCQTLIRPVGKLKDVSRWITGISQDDLEKAPTLESCHPTIQAALHARPLVLIYNAEFDKRVLNQSTFHAGLPEFKLPRVDDLMMHLSRWVGDWNAKHNDYSWPRLEGGHRAVGDCRAMISLMEKMARLPQTDQKWDPTHGR